MKIKKINENQIRCTLTKEDLASRHIKLSELAYGSEKAKALFRDMMQQAAEEHGFEADDIPLMIEAIPLSSETIMLIITKVESPEELDTRFSSFTDTAKDDESEEISLEDDNPFSLNHARDISELSELFSQLKDEQDLTDSSDTVSLDENDESRDDISDQNTADSQDTETSKSLTRMFTFANLDTAFDLARLLNGFYTGDNALYKNPKDGLYYLVIRQDMHSTSDFRTIYLTVAAHTHEVAYSQNKESFFQEHGRIILSSHALQTLADI